ncbi:GNAT family protein [uncultured Sphingomonas sp.]|uniref:GNAT family N-acetyltransferase n=1 Tax=uncultured Sphingomonas sp. TaxID=158754 RepID=UPI0025E01991|nr:GNAT family protein [uncultured Sphingomonas sp.]
MTDLGAALVDDDLRLEPLTAAHRPALKAACAEDREIWPLYSVSWDPDHFDAQFDALLARPASYPFAIVDGGALIGMTAYLGHLPGRQTVEIGNSYIVPAARGTGLNRRIKRLLLDRAFAQDIRRVEFRVDMRNARSLAAVARLGARRDGVLRAERVTWTGHVRDTALFSILAGEWQG